jgi:predicted amino acid racemase
MSSLAMACMAPRPLHVVDDLPELPAVVYVSEVSHHHGSEAYCFGGGLYIDPIFADYPVRAVVAREPTVAEAALRTVEIPPPAAIDYYGMIDASAGLKPAVGDTVVFGFRRTSVFVTRAYVVGVSGISSGVLEGGEHREFIRRNHDAWPIEEGRA